MSGAVLAVDSSAGTSVAVLLPDGRVVEAVSDDPLRHAEAIGVLLDSVVREAGLTGADIDVVVAGMGPGPFTGLRVGIAAARAFAFGADARVVPIVSHDAPAWDAWASGERGSLLVVTDARRREVYWSSYALTDDGILRVDGPGLAKEPDLPAGYGMRADHPRISAASLALRAQRLIEDGGPFAEDRALYLRAPDVTPSAGPKRVSR